MSNHIDVRTGGSYGDMLLHPKHEAMLDDALLTRTPSASDAKSLALALRKTVVQLHLWMAGHGNRELSDRAIDAALQILAPLERGRTD